MEINKNIESIIGDPKKAINRLAYPTILSMLLMYANNLIDSMYSCLHCTWLLLVLV